MIKSFNVDETCSQMRIDRWLRFKIGKMPQSLIEKSLRNGKIKVNQKKVKSSFKLNKNDKIDLYNFDFKEKIINEKVNFQPTNKIIKENEDLIIDISNANFRLKNNNYYMTNLQEQITDKKKELKELLQKDSGNNGKLKDTIFKKNMKLAETLVILMTIFFVIYIYSKKK